jgi:hypothetical protein
MPKFNPEEVAALRYVVRWATRVWSGRDRPSQQDRPTARQLTLAMNVVLADLGWDR